MSFGDLFLSHVLLRLYACVVGGAQETMEIKSSGGAAEGTERSPPRRIGFQRRVRIGVSPGSNRRANNISK